jgi:hypothetical protein
MSNIAKTATSGTKTGPGAINPASITHAFSVNGGHLAWAILDGLKTIENRDFRIDPGWYGLAVTANAHTGVGEDKTYRERFPDKYPGFQTFYSWKGCLVGAVYVSHSLPHSKCKDDWFACDNYKVKNIITQTINLDVCIPCRGFLGTWPMSDEARVQLHDAIHKHCLDGQKKYEEDGTMPVLQTGGEKKYPRDPVWESKSGIKFEAYESASNSKSKTKQQTKGKTVAPPRKPIPKTIMKTKIVTGKEESSSVISGLQRPLVASTSPSAHGAADIRQFFGGK